MAEYKQRKSSLGALGNEDIDQNFDECLFAGVLSERLKQIAEGHGSASAYHSFITGILTFLFYPHLIRPVKEKEIHEGRKRIDILFTNAGQEGFFHQMLSAAQTRSIVVPVECKNYKEDIANPEFDQLGQRFGHQRGFFGILMCRSLVDRATAIKRCRDSVNDGRGYIIILTDADVEEMLLLVSGNRRSDISEAMRRRFAEITV